MRYLFLIFLFFTTQVFAAEFKVVKHSGYTEIYINGLIEDGDYDKFKSLEVTGIVDVILNSDGGKSYDAMRIGEYIRQMEYNTQVLGTDSCFSACGFIWLAGKHKGLENTASVGFHGSFTIFNGKRTQSVVGNALVGAYLGKLGYSDEIIEYVVKPLPDDMNILDRKEIQLLELPVFIKIDGKWYSPITTPSITILTSMALVSEISKFCSYKFLSKDKVSIIDNKITHESIMVSIDIKGRASAIFNEYVRGTDFTKLSKWKQCSILYEEYKTLSTQISEFNYNENIFN